MGVLPRPCLSAAADYHPDWDTPSGDDFLELVVFIDFERKTRHAHPRRDQGVASYVGLLAATGKSEAEIRAAIVSLMTEGP